MNTARGSVACMSEITKEQIDEIGKQLAEDAAAGRLPSQNGMGPGTMCTCGKPRIDMCHVDRLSHSDPGDKELMLLARGVSVSGTNEWANSLCWQSPGNCNGGKHA